MTFDLDLYFQGQSAMTAKISHILWCPLYSIFSSGWILSIFATYDHHHKSVCSAQWLLTLTYIFKVIQPWVCNKTAKIWHILSCPLYSLYFSGWIIFIFDANDHWHERVCHMQWPLILTCVFNHDFVMKLLKYGTFYLVHYTTCTALNGFFSYLAQMIYSMRGCFGQNVFWPWGILRMQTF